MEQLENLPGICQSPIGNSSLYQNLKNKNEICY